MVVNLIEGKKNHENVSIHEEGPLYTKPFENANKGGH